MKTSIGELLEDCTKLRDFTDRMPSTRVAVTLKDRLGQLEPRTQVRRTFRTFRD